MSLSDKDQEIVWHPYTQAALDGPPIVIRRGSGSYLYDEQGRAYIDAISSWWVNLHGHSHPHIARKVSEQLQQLEHVIFAGFTHEPAVRLAERLLGHLPSNQKRIFFSDNGSTAVETALKIALRYWYNRGEDRRTVIALENGYHGDTFGAMAVSDQSCFVEAFKPFLFQVQRVPAPAPGREEQALRRLEQVLAEAPAALFIFEPLVQCAGGMVMHSPQALSALIRCCREHGVVTIADEVAVGFGRTGRYFACDQLEDKPDMMCLSKGLSGGTLPLAVTSCAQYLFEAFCQPERAKGLMHGHSYTANPVGCAAGLASLDLLEKNECWDQIRMISAMHAEFLQELSVNPRAGNPRSCGTILAFDVLTPEGVSYLNPVREQLYRAFLGASVLLRPLGNVVYVMPPYCISRSELKRVYRVIVDTLAGLER